MDLGPNTSPQNWDLKVQALSTKLMALVDVELAKFSMIN